MNDLQNRLGRREGFEDICADRPFFDLGNELFRCRKRHVGLQQGNAYFPQCLIDVAFANSSSTGEPIEYGA